MQRFTNLRVWQKAHEAVLDAYRLTERFPRDERFGLTAQLRRAIASVPTNIAEGAKRRTHRDFARFLNLAEGSLAESEYLLMLARDLQLADAAAVAELCAKLTEVAKMLNALRDRVEDEV